MSDEAIQVAVDTCTIEQMRQWEEENAIEVWISTPVQRHKGNPNVFHCRKGIVGEHKKALKKKDLDYVNERLEGMIFWSDR